MRSLAQQDHVHMQVFTLAQRVLIFLKLHLGLLLHVIRVIGVLRHCDLLQGSLDY